MLEELRYPASEVPNLIINEITQYKCPIHSASEKLPSWQGSFYFAGTIMEWKGI